MKTVTVTDSNYADLYDVALFSMDESRWNDYTDSELEDLGAVIVNREFKGNIVEAYRTICKR
jgi:hypothetical protein